MAATREDLIQWFEAGVARKAIYMVVICDTYDHEDYPSYFASQNAARAKMLNPGSMQRVMEVYDLTADMDMQMNVPRAMALAE